MKKTALIIFIALLLPGFVSAQDLSAFNQDTLKNKMKIYTDMLADANIYVIKAEEELKNVKLYKSQAHAFMDSAYIYAQKAELDKSNAQLYLLQFNYAYELANRSISKADTLMLLVTAYKDTAAMKNREAETYYLQLVDMYAPLFETDSAHPIIYTVQLGAGNMDLDYFSKAADYEIITPSDGIKRFITGNFNTKAEALEHKQKMIDLGYTDAFIRSMESLNY